LFSNRLLSSSTHFSRGVCLREHLVIVVCVVRSALFSVALLPCLFVSSSPYFSFSPETYLTTAGRPRNSLVLRSRACFPGLRMPQKRKKNGKSKNGQSAKARKTDGNGKSSKQPASSRPNPGRLPPKLLHALISVRQTSNAENLTPKISHSDLENYFNGQGSNGSTVLVWNSAVQHIRAGTLKGLLGTADASKGSAVDFPKLIDLVFRPLLSGLKYFKSVEQSCKLVAASPGKDLSSQKRSWFTIFDILPTRLSINLQSNDPSEINEICNSWVEFLPDSDRSFRLLSVEDVNALVTQANSDSVLDTNSGGSDSTAALPSVFISASGSVIVDGERVFQADKVTSVTRLCSNVYYGKGRDSSRSKLYEVPIDGLPLPVSILNVSDLKTLRKRLRHFRVDMVTTRLSDTKIDSEASKLLSLFRFGSYPDWEGSAFGEKCFEPIFLLLKDKNFSLRKGFSIAPLPDSSSVPTADFIYAAEQRVIAMFRQANEILLPILSKLTGRAIPSSGVSSNLHDNLAHFLCNTAKSSASLQDLPVLSAGDRFFRRPCASVKNGKDVLSLKMYTDLLMDNREAFLRALRVDSSVSSDNFRFMELYTAKTLFAHTFQELLEYDSKINHLYSKRFELRKLWDDRKNYNTPAAWLIALRQLFVDTSVYAVQSASHMTANRAHQAHVLQTFDFKDLYSRSAVSPTSGALSSVAAAGDRCKNFLTKAGFSKDDATQVAHYIACGKSKLPTARNAAYAIASKSTAYLSAMHASPQSVGHGNSVSITPSAPQPIGPVIPRGTALVNQPSVPHYDTRQVLLDCVGNCRLTQIEKKTITRLVQLRYTE